MALILKTTDTNHQKGLKVKEKCFLVFTGWWKETKVPGRTCKLGWQCTGSTVFSHCEGCGFNSWQNWRVKHHGWSSLLTKYCVSTDRVPFKYKESWLGLYSIELCSSVEPYTSKQHDKILHIFIVLQKQTSICAKNNNLNVIYPTLGKFLPHNSKIANAISNVILLYCHLQALFPTTGNVIWCRFWLHCVKETHKCEKPSLRLNNRKTNSMFLLWCYRGQSNWSLLQEEGGGKRGGVSHVWKSPE